MVSCATAWHVQNPHVLVMYGDPADYYATLFGRGYNAVLAPLFSSGTWTSAGTTAGTWDPSEALAEFQQQYTAQRNINAVLTPNDENAAPIITYLQQQGIHPRTFPVTGQDATLTGLQNILTGYQCGTAYKPIYLEAEAAAALAIYLQAGATPPPGLVNHTVTDPTSGVSVPAVLVPPTWVTAANMASTVIADHFVSASQLCTPQYQAACTAARIPG